MSHFGKICRDLVIWVLAQFVEARFVDWPKAALQSSSADGSSRSRYSPPTGWSLGQPGSLQEYLLLSPFQSFMAVGHELDVSKVQVHTHVAIPITPETIALMEFTTTRSGIYHDSVSSVICSAPNGSETAHKKDCSVEEMVRVLA